MKNLLIILMLSTVLLSGCATIMGDGTQLIPISSSPLDASISIRDEKGVIFFKGKTPTTVTLPKSDGSYWGKKNFTVTIRKDGFDTQTIPIQANANGWYIGGNLIFGTLIGWFVVDPLSGAMYTLSPQEINASLGEKTAHNNITEGSISIVLLQDVPSSLVHQMSKVN